MSSQGDDREPGRSYREGVGPADPPPVTDAMITPRTAPPQVEPGGPVCHVCGEHNRPSSTYCLQCGSKLREDDGIEPAASPSSDSTDLVGDAADEGWWDPDLDDEPWNRPEEPPPPETASSETYETNETQDVDVPARDPRETARMFVWGLLALAAFVIVLTTFIGGGGDEAGDATTTTLVAGVDAQLYGALIADLADDVDTLGDQATLINERWDSDDADFQETLAALENLSADMSDVAERLRVQEPPQGLSPENHTRLVSSAGTLERAASGMVDGLKAPDAGEERRGALARFSASVAEFRAVADTLLQVIDLTGSPDEG